MSDPTGSPQQSEIPALFSRYVDGLASAEEVAQLEQHLLADDATAQQFSQWCLVHRQISELMTEDALHEMMDRFVQGAPGPPRGVFARPAAEAAQIDQRDQREPLRRFRRWRGVIAIAATLAGIGLAAAFWEGGTAAPSSEGDPIIATVTRLVDAVWAAQTSPRAPGDQLTVNDRVALDSGMVKVTFECGAEVVLEGPCDFEIRSSMLGYLNSGRMTADVPRRAFGFAILSPGVDFVDLGTSFGVNVGNNGRTELHVFEGEVLCSQSVMPREDRGETVHVQANNAMEFATEGGNPSGIAMDLEPFSELIAMRRPTSLDAQRLLPEKLALWLAADASVDTDDAGRVISWHDMLYGDNQSAEDAVQSEPLARPRLAARAINGRPAVRFDGEADFLLTTPLETTDDQTVLIVGQFSQSAFKPGRRWGGQILNYDGPPSRYLSDLLEPGVLQIGEPLLEAEFEPTLLTGQVFAGFIGSATVEVGRVDAVEPIGAATPYVLSYVYDYGARQAELQINGHSYGTSRAYAPQGITSRKIIGRHAWMQNFFHGDLAELVIYNRALTPEQLASTTRFLAEKYDIELEAAEASP